MAILAVAAGCWAPAGAEEAAHRERGRACAPQPLSRAGAAIGAHPTRADIRFFVERWPGDPGRRARRLDPRWSDLGLALEADGGGAKRALAVQAGS